MKDRHAPKTKALGMPYSTAAARLDRLVLFKVVVAAGLDVCHQCADRIKTSQELSIEHKIPWFPDPALFWDLGNISFSHKRCNSGAARKNTAAYLNMLRSRPRATRLGLAKVDVSRFPEAKALLASGMSERRVAKMLGLHHSTFQAIVKGRTWKAEWSEATALLQTVASSEASK